MENLLRANEFEDNALIAYRVQTLADGLRDQEKFDESEAEYKKALKIIASIYGETHPFILQYNGNLITNTNIRKNNAQDITEE